MAGYNNYGPPPGHYDERMESQCEAAQVPYTEQLIDRLGESEKRIADMQITMSRIADKLFGAQPMKLESAMKDNPNVPVQRSVIDQLLAQSNIVNRRLSDLSEIINRLNAL